MAHKYCKSCGSKNEYVGSAPKFCSNCGKPMDSATVAKRVVKNSVAQQKRSEVFADDETDIDYVPNVASLQYDVSPFEKKSFKVEDLFDLNESDEGDGEKEAR